MTQVGTSNLAIVGNVVAIMLPPLIGLGLRGREVNPFSSSSFGAIGAVSLFALAGLAKAYQWSETECTYDFFWGEYCWEKLCHYEQVCNGWNCIIEKVCLNFT